MEAGLQDLLAETTAGNCDQAEARWSRLRRHRGPHHPWSLEARATVDTALASCLADKALKAPAADGADWVTKARRLDHNAPKVAAASLRCADHFQALGQAETDDDAAYQAFHTTLLCDPSRSHLRRQAEQLRAHRLENTLR